MADFIWVESPGTARQIRPRVARTRFGDGYEERAPDGLNPIAQHWTLNFTDIDSAIADEIETFLRARFTPAAGQEAFNWVPLWGTTAIRVTCSEWQRTLGGRPDTSTVTAVFEQVFEP